MDNREPQAAPRRTSKIIWSVLLIIVVIGLAFWLFRANGSGKRISLDTFYMELEAGNIAEVNLGTKTINIKYKNGQKAWFYSRNAVEEQITNDVTEYNKTNPASVVKLVPDTTTTFSFINFLYILLVVGSTIFLIFWVTKQIKGANSKSFDFVKNRARIGDSTVKFDDVAGADEEKQEVAEIVEFLKNPKRFSDIGARIPKGVLLVGPPGTGKTLLAKAIAGEAGVPFFTISGSDFMELFVGVGASRVRDLFAQAKRVKPCIVFIDEIDAVGRQRGAGMGGGNDEREQTLNQLLVQMDGFEPNEGIIVLAATNRADILDPALMRPGRFDRQIYIHVPDVRGREEILKVHAKNKKFEGDIDFGEFARITSGFTGADLENLLNEAAILAARNGRTAIRKKDISDGIDKVILGPQKKSWVMTLKDKERTAYHEAGHAIVQHYVSNHEPIHEVSIIPRGAAAGYTLSRPSDDDKHVTKGKLIDQICMLLGGRVSEEDFLKDVSTGASNDIQRATEIARNMVTKWGMSEKIGLVCLDSENEVFLGRDYQTKAVYGENQAAVVDEEIRRILDECKKVTHQLILKHKKEVETLVKALIEKETLYEDEINLVFEGKNVKSIINYIDEKISKNKVKKEEEKPIKSEIPDVYMQIEKPTLQVEPQKELDELKKSLAEKAVEPKAEEKPPVVEEKPKVVSNRVKKEEEKPENTAPKKPAAKKPSGAKATGEKTTSKKVVEPSEKPEDIKPEAPKKERHVISSDEQDIPDNIGDAIKKDKKD